MVRRVPRTGPALHQLTRVPEAAVSLVVDAVSVEPSLVWTIATFLGCFVVASDRQQRENRDEVVTGTSIESGLSATEFVTL